MKRCPYCAEKIQDGAVVCRYCGRDLPEAPEPRPPGASASFTLPAGTVVLLIFASLLALLASLLTALAIQQEYQGYDEQLQAFMSGQTDPGDNLFKSNWYREGDAVCRDYHDPTDPASNRHSCTTPAELRRSQSGVPVQAAILLLVLIGPPALEWRLLAIGKRKAALIAAMVSLPRILASCLFGPFMILGA